MKWLIFPIFLAFTSSCNNPKKEILYAILDDDLATITLKLFDDYTFETSTNTLFNAEVLNGNYALKGDTIVFLDSPHANDFIPNKILIDNDKLILRFMEDGKIDTSFASYFSIKKNNL